VADLDRRLIEIESDLQKCEETCQNLNMELTNASGEELITIQESLDFYAANIRGLSEEREQIKGKLSFMHILDN
jgi:hypothetical protein